MSKETIVHSLGRNAGYSGIIQFNGKDVGLIRTNTREAILRVQNCVNVLAKYEDPTELRKQRDELIIALSQLKRGDCWCESGIGNPMMKGGHSYDCNFAKQTLVRCNLSETENKL